MDVLIFKTPGRYREGVYSLVHRQVHFKVSLNSSLNSWVLLLFRD